MFTFTTFLHVYFSLIFVCTHNYTNSTEQINKLFTHLSLRKNDITHKAHVYAFFFTSVHKKNLHTYSHQILIKVTFEQLRKIRS